VAAAAPMAREYHHKGAPVRECARAAHRFGSPRGRECAGYSPDLSGYSPAFQVLEEELHGGGERRGTTHGALGKGTYVRVFHTHIPPSPNQERVQETGLHSSIAMPDE